MIRLLRDGTQACAWCTRMMRETRMGRAFGAILHQTREGGCPAWRSICSIDAANRWCGFACSGRDWLPWGPRL